MVMIKQKANILPIFFFESGDKHHNLGMDNVTHYAYCDFPGYSLWKKYIVTFFATCIVTFYPVT
jgi:hypothetical protein